MIDELMDRITQLESTVSRLIRTGEVVGIDEKRHAVRVQFPDADGVVSYWLPVLVDKAHVDKAVHALDIGEHVTCVFLPNGQEAGFVIGAFYSDGDSVPVASRDKRHIRFNDGAVIEYDRSAHKLQATVPGQVEITAAGSVDIFSDKDITLRTSRKISMEAPEIEMAASVKIIGPLSTGGANGESLPVTFNGPIIHRGGDFVSENDVIASGVSLVKHPHEGGTALPVPTGGGNTSSAISSWNNSTAMAADEAARNEQAQLFSDFRAAKVDDAKTTEEDRLLLCIPDIAEAEAGRKSEPDRTGWLHLADFIRKWFTGTPSNNKKTRNLSYVSWEWLLQYSRVQEAWSSLTDHKNLFSEKSCSDLTKILQEDGLFTSSRQHFDYITIPVSELTHGYFQRVDRKFSLSSGIDGLYASLGEFSIRVCGAGYTEPVSGGHRVVVERVAFHILDGFDFEVNPDSLIPQYLGGWDCTHKTFNTSLPWNVQNRTFREFRNRHGAGGDFYVCALPREVDRFQEYAYEV
ncbi:MAG: phage baseplate assembly protein V [Desulfovibrio sp.]